ERGAVLLGETVQSFTNSSTRVGQHEGISFNWRIYPFGVMLWRITTQIFSAARPQRVDRSSSRDRQQPCDRLTSRRVITSGLLPTLPEHVDDNIFGILAATQDTKNQAEGEPIVSRIESIQGHRVARCHTSDQVPIFPLDLFLVRHAHGHSSRL